MTSGIGDESSGVIMDESIKAFLKDKVDSFIKWDLVRFFHDNPHTKDTAENIARYTGRDVSTVRRELDALAESDVITAEVVNHVTIYYLVSDVETRQTIHRFMEACHDRHFRVQAINEVIKAMQFSPRHDF